MAELLSALWTGCALLFVFSPEYVWSLVVWKKVAGDLTCERDLALLHLVLLVMYPMCALVCGELCVSTRKIAAENAALFTKNDILSMYMFSLLPVAASAVSWTTTGMTLYAKCLASVEKREAFGSAAAAAALHCFVVPLCVLLGLAMLTLWAHKSAHTT